MQAFLPVGLDVGRHRCSFPDLCSRCVETHPESLTPRCGLQGTHQQILQASLGFGSRWEASAIRRLDLHPIDTEDAPVVTGDVPGEQVPTACALDEAVGLHLPM
jgi:hypothetical protein